MDDGTKRIHRKASLAWLLLALSLTYSSSFPPLLAPYAVVLVSVSSVTPEPSGLLCALT